MKTIINQMALCVLIVCMARNVQSEGYGSYNVVDQAAPAKKADYTAPAAYDNKGTDYPKQEYVGSYDDNYNVVHKEPMPELHYNPCNYDNTQVYWPVDGMSSQYFIQCNWEHPYLFKCPGDLVWNQHKTACDFPYSRSYPATGYDQEYKSDSYADAKPAPYSSYNAAPAPTYKKEYDNYATKLSMKPSNDQYGYRYGHKEMSQYAAAPAPAHVPMQKPQYNNQYAAPAPMKNQQYGNQYSAPAPMKKQTYGNQYHAPAPKPYKQQPYQASAPAPMKNQQYGNQYSAPAPMKKQTYGNQYAAPAPAPAPTKKQTYGNQYAAPAPAPAPMKKQQSYY